MDTFKELWQKLANSKKYRNGLVGSLLKRGTALQIQGLLKTKGWTQEQLAEKSGLTQGVISRAQNPAYGNLTFNTVINIAAGFDVAFIGRFVPFSEFAKWVENMPNRLSFDMPSFDKENEMAAAVQGPIGAALLGSSQREEPVKDWKQPETASRLGKMPVQGVLGGLRQGERYESA